MARIKFKISNGIWEVFEFSDEHNHSMIKINLRHFILSGRRLTGATKDIFSSMVDVGIHTKKAVRYIQNEAGGIENARFIEQDTHNFIQAHIKSTQRSESTNRVFTEMVCETMTLTEFVHHYEQRAVEMEYLKKVINVEMNGTCHTYTVLKGESGHFETVQFNSMDNSTSCSGLMFESLGWLCCHALKVLFLQLDLSYIPQQYILKRWTKNAKQGNEFEEYHKKNTPASSMAIRLNGLIKESFTVMTLAANDVESEEIVRKYLYQARVEITKAQSELYVKGTYKYCPKSSISAGPSSGIHDQILDPIKKKGNRNGYERLKPRIAQRKKRAPQKTLKARAIEQ
ncbi:protein FAR1-RELATED SEQUENCE 12-like [Lycium barbarum]|uniref:protein FAR1-RELATED SEQUENCE 12-like n=1 Tax=Lycium barbarum TaxID=112863 RepID=UPI00293F68C3|nr:protein FAR1-RELATED SEQUENCE 12-like [Lycium barbarum]